MYFLPLTIAAIRATLLFLCLTVLAALTQWPLAITVPCALLATISFCVACALAFIAIIAEG